VVVQGHRLDTDGLSKLAHAERFDPALICEANGSLQHALPGEGDAGPGFRVVVLSHTPDVLLPELTPREREILTLMAAGDANMTIARRLGLSEKTVRNNVSNIFTKLRVTNRAAAVARARDAGVGKH
jgi:DNA-binding NarL/FixJ family response regulator